MYWKSIIILMAISMGVIWDPVDAIEFSQPVKLGTFEWNQVGHGFMIEGATYNHGDKYTKIRGKASKGFGKGMAQFGQGKDAIYISYDVYQKEPVAYMGNRNMSSFVDFGSVRKVIYCVDSDSDLVVYPLSVVHSFFDFELVGKRRDGTFVKFVDSNDISEAYFRRKYGCDYSLNTMRVEGDTIVVPYSCQFGNLEKGEFHFQWDEDAQWFGVEQVVY